MTCTKVKARICCRTDTFQG